MHTGNFYKKLIYIGFKLQNMWTYCLKCKKSTERINSRVFKTKNVRTIVLSNCVVCGSKKSKFIKEQEAKGLLSSSGIKTPLNKTPLIGDILFYFSCA